MVKGKKLRPETGQKQLPDLMVLLGAASGVVFKLFQFKMGRYLFDPVLVGLWPHFLCSVKSPVKDQVSVLRLFKS